MITARPTEHLTGIIIEGEYEDFDELVDGIYRMTDRWRRRKPVGEWGLAGTMQEAQGLSHVAAALF